MIQSIVASVLEYHMCTQIIGMIQSKHWKEDIYEIRHI